MTSEHQDCCRQEVASEAGVSPGSRERAGLWAAGASVGSAVAASACCWLPLVLVAFGVSAVGVSAKLEKVRPLLLGICPVLLGVGFYLVYFRKRACVPESACAAPNARIKRFSRVMLWVATVGVVAFAFFPSYAGFLVAGTPSGEAAENATGPAAVTLKIEGMTCEGCAVRVQTALAAVPGVRSASVVYADGQARVVMDPASPPSRDVLVTAVANAGYRAHLILDDR